MELVDTHCHIHFSDYGLDPEAVLHAAHAEGVTKLICVGCTLEDSRAGVAFARNHDGVWASIGIHPHEAAVAVKKTGTMQQLDGLATDPAVIAVGEIGLDYYYNHSPREAQRELFVEQLKLAQKHNLAVIFHVREAFEDFFAIMDDFRGLRGVVHSFSTNSAILQKILSRGLFVGLNGIMTFTRDEKQLAAAKAVPLDRLVLETDAPFLTPSPFRGKICEPKHVRTIGEFLADLRGDDLSVLAAATTRNVNMVFGI